MPSASIPALTRVDPEVFSVAVADLDGRVFTAGDSDHVFTMQSLSKPFLFALVSELHGLDRARSHLGGNNTGLAYNSLIAVELNGGDPRNPMVNAGALITTSLVPGDTDQDRWEFLRNGLSRFVGRRLEASQDVYASEVAHNFRNRAIANLLASYGRIPGDPVELTELYTRQCALEITVAELALMGATLAEGGVQPVTGDAVISASTCRATLAMLAASGMYEDSGDWLIEVGLPAKSGVSGGVIAVVPGLGAIAAFSPRLDSAGTSVRGKGAITFLSGALGLSIFGSPEPDRRPVGAERPRRVE